MTPDDSLSFPAEAEPAASRIKRRMQLSDEVASHIRDLIMSGQLRGGEFVRLEKLAEELGVSSTPVREGLLALRGEGFVRQERHRGFVVVELSRDDINDLFLVQATVAGELAARATERLTPADLARLERVQFDLNEAAQLGLVREIDELNDTFHRIINRAANSKKLAWFLSIAVQYVPRRYFASITGWREASVHDHSDIIEALRSHDAEGARREMSAHIIHAGELLADNLAQAGGTTAEDSA
jgi:DNA-binding GntR family transcriptional regulator